MQCYYSHYFLGVRKKLQALAKNKECKFVAGWEKSITNHLYWCASSTPICDGEMIKAKWLSLVNHIHNVHHNHGEKSPGCAHRPLTGREQKKKIV